MPLHRNEHEFTFSIKLSGLVAEPRVAPPRSPRRAPLSPYHDIRHHGPFPICATRLREVVVPLDGTYFTPDAARMLELARAAGCGCAAYGVGCAVCGNALGALFTPCRTHTARSSGSLRRQQHYVFLPGHVSPAIHDARAQTQAPTTTPTNADATPRPPAVTLPPLPIRTSGSSVESGRGAFPTSNSARDAGEAETARGDVDDAPPVPDTFVVMESPFREMYQRRRAVSLRAGDADSGNTNLSDGENRNAAQGASPTTDANQFNNDVDADSDDVVMRVLDAERMRRGLGPEPRLESGAPHRIRAGRLASGRWLVRAAPALAAGILPPLEIVAPPVIGAGPGPGPGSTAVAAGVTTTADQPRAGGIEATNDGEAEMIEVLRMVAEMGTPVPLPVAAPGADRRAAMHRLAAEQGRMDRGTPGPVTGAMGDGGWGAGGQRPRRGGPAGGC
ncbi:hypothetical protein MIND_01160400 [Mycena indigotica]|uniref:Uncharacterized protein n=1 Tax=Mycena indigotica TaxID=2126181 RepID=A0A8H6S3Q8_9AGAR|nr:uncharacterized protein MIND_01160400 [Mycena indigotica]KAF7292625.1 hypothetical protein MIND_01160400 [Mycena indigotica]